MRLRLNDGIDGGSASAGDGGSMGIRPSTDNVIGDGGTGCIGDGGTTI